MALQSGYKRNNERARPPRRKSPATTRHDWERVDKLSRNREASPATEIWNVEFRSCLECASFALPSDQERPVLLVLGLARVVRWLSCAAVSRRLGVAVELGPGREPG